ncbi:hypothetical protein ABT247_04840 [Kitasatospora sp. NPDC001539]|uniref:hypothetical protein n=1 Tax=Kitasatospora sp. NPDC001539 TaxID=3154384 RepID=UPI003323C5FE
MSRPTHYAVAASGEWFDEDDNTRLPAGEVHAWERGKNQTVCGLPLHRARLRRFAHVGWAEVQPDSGGAADRVARVCPRCAAGAGPRAEPSWRRIAPRP